MSLEYAPTAAVAGADALPHAPPTVANEPSASTHATDPWSDVPVPPLATSVSAVLAATAAAEPDLRLVIDAVGSDPSMAAHVLRTANSAMYRGKDSVRTIAHAITRLGARRLREVALVAAVAETARTLPRVFAEIVAEEMRVARLRALWAAEIARVRRSNVDDAFLAGLFVDIGMPVALTFAAERVTTSRARATILKIARPAPSTVAHEDRAFLLAEAAQCHPAVGARICAAWGLPSDLVETVAHHHDAEVPSDEPVTSSSGVHVVALAHAFAAAAEELDGRAMSAHPSAVALNLYPDDVAAVLARRTQVEGLAAGLV